MAVQLTTTHGKLVRHTPFHRLFVLQGCVPDYSAAPQQDTENVVRTFATCAVPALSAGRVTSSPCTPQPQLCGAVQTWILRRLSHPCVFDVAVLRLLSRMALGGADYRAERSLLHGRPNRCLVLQMALSWFVKSVLCTAGDGEHGESIYDTPDHLFEDEIVAQLGHDKPGCAGRTALCCSCAHTSYCVSMGKRGVHGKQWTAKSQRVAVLHHLCSHATVQR